MAQKELVLNAGLGFVEYDAIAIEYSKTSIESNIPNVIFTSKNAVRAIEKFGTNISKCFCVGESTKQILIKNGQNVVEMAQNASDLAKIIVKKYKKESFLFFCGNLRRDELPNLLQQHDIHLQEQIVYKTSINPRKFERVFNGILFFSPSGVRSYVLKNTIEEPTVVFCIGTTTASEAKKYTTNVIIANKPTVENVIVQAVKYFRNQ